MIHITIKQAGKVTLDKQYDESSPHAAWRLLEAFIAKCEGREDYKEIGRRAEMKAAEDWIAGQRKQEQQTCTLQSNGTENSSTSISTPRRDKTLF